MDIPSTTPTNSSIELPNASQPMYKAIPDNPLSLRRLIGQAAQDPDPQTVSPRYYTAVLSTVKRAEDTPWKDVEGYPVMATITEVNAAQDSSTVPTIIGELERVASSWEYTVTFSDDVVTLLLARTAAGELLALPFTNTNTHGYTHSRDQLNYKMMRAFNFPRLLQNPMAQVAQQDPFVQPNPLVIVPEPHQHPQAVIELEPIEDQHFLEPTVTIIPINTSEPSNREWAQGPPPSSCKALLSAAVTALRRTVCFPKRDNEQSHKQATAE
ncbi:hypothetical protein EDD21DRAFT_445220 [Dissophora ornata]|nr:hypothetical protein EDD21DRAFT_445220 [Dissophora ornata]